MWAMLLLLLKKLSWVGNQVQNLHYFYFAQVLGGGVVAKNGQNLFRGIKRKREFRAISPNWLECSPPPWKT